MRVAAVLVLLLVTLVCAEPDPAPKSYSRVMIRTGSG